MSSPIPTILASDSGPWAQVRTGTVIAVSATSVEVLVGGTSIQASYLTTYTPAAGHLVALLRQDSTWLCLGRIAGSGQNEVQNPGFEASPVGLPPTQWEFANLTGLSQAVVADDTPPEGSQFAIVVSDSATSNSYLYSSPISVTAGQVLAVSAYVTGFYDINAPQTADAALVALWFAGITDLYPTTSSADIAVATYTDVPSGPPFVQLSGQVTAPVSGFMRLALRSTMAVNQSLGWDLASVRRIG
jgi:hypothetical protein